jgi:hypothetical protein
MHHYYSAFRSPLVGLFFSCLQLLIIDSLHG